MTSSTSFPTLITTHATPSPSRYSTLAHKYNPISTEQATSSSLEKSSENRQNAVWWSLTTHPTKKPHLHQYSMEQRPQRPTHLSHPLIHTHITSFRTIRPYKRIKHIPHFRTELRSRLQYRTLHKLIRYLSHSHRWHFLCPNIIPP